MTHAQQKALKSFNILIAEPDPHLAGVLKAMLVGMGFAHTNIVRTEDDAFTSACSSIYDFILTELSLRGGSGLRLVERIRTEPESPNPTIPVIAVSARAEISDVAAARDKGVNEFVVKPFTTQNIYSRLERIVEFPRDFLISSNYIGPERRFRSKALDGKDRRVTRPIEQPMTVGAAKRKDGITTPRLLKREYSLKKKLGTGTSLKDVITPEILASAQATVLAMATGALAWISKDIEQLQLSLAAMRNAPDDHGHLAAFTQHAYDLESRAGTFSFHQPAQVARLLREFARDHLSPHNIQHLTVAEKHIDVLVVIMGQLLKKSPVSGVDEIVKALGILTSRFT